MEKERQGKEENRSIIWQEGISVIYKQKCQCLETYVSQPDASFYSFLWIKEAIGYSG